MKKSFALFAFGLSLSWMAPAHAFIYLECDNSDVTFGVYGSSQSDADACLGWDNQYGNPTFEQSLIESEFGTESGNDWVYVTKWKGWTATGTYGDVSFTLTANTYYDAWTLSWNDPSGNTLPEDFDIAVVLKAGQGTGGYLFDDVYIPVSPNTGLGDFEVGILNNRGNALNLSHLTLFIREGSGGGGGDGDCGSGGGGDCGGGGGNSVPVPGTLGLLGAAIYGLRRRKVDSVPAEDGDD